MTVAFCGTDTGTEVEISGKANGSFQAYDWNEADFIAQRFLTELTSELTGRAERN